MPILIGDVFRCKRRGHEVIVRAISTLSPYASGIGSVDIFYRNIRGAMVKIKASRLLNASRFDRMPVEALKHPYEGITDQNSAEKEAALVNPA